MLQGQPRRDNATPGRVEFRGCVGLRTCWECSSAERKRLAVPVAAQQPAGVSGASVIDMTLERMTQLALSNSYEVRFLSMNIEQTTQRLRAERARLRSSVSVDLSTPVWEDISQEHFNTSLGRNEFFSENALRFEGQISIRQPVILFGYPTNGYLSLNNRVYRLAQRETDGDRDVKYYNRYFIRYTQPLFQPNELGNSLEEGRARTWRARRSTTTTTSSS